MNDMKHLPDVRWPTVILDGQSFATATYVQSRTASSAGTCVNALPLTRNVRAHRMFNSGDRGGDEQVSLERGVPLARSTCAEDWFSPLLLRGGAMPAIFGRGAGKLRLAHHGPNPLSRINESADVSITPP